MLQDNPILYQKLQYLVHRALVDVRNLALAQRHAQIADLADTFEIIPSLAAEWEEGHEGIIRAALTEYQEKHGPAAVDYLSILDMEDDHFREVYLHRGVA